jgi:hypothetical protein
MAVAHITIPITDFAIIIVYPVASIAHPVILIFHFTTLSGKSYRNQYSFNFAS